jgi:hypothetical protein
MPFAVVVAGRPSCPLEEWEEGGGKGGGKGGRRKYEEFEHDEFESNSNMLGGALSHATN